MISNDAMETFAVVAILATVLTGVLAVVYAMRPHIFHCEWPKWKDSDAELDGLESIFLYQNRTCLTCGKTQFRKTRRFPING